MWPAVKGLPDLAAKAPCRVVEDNWEVLINFIDEAKCLNVNYSFSHLNIKELNSKSVQASSHPAVGNQGW